MNKVLGYLYIISQNKQKRNTSLFGRTQGFTIVELLIVVVVIAVLAAITIVAYNGITNQAKSAAQTSELSQWKKQSELHKVEHGIECPANYSFVYGNTVLGTSDFCVMKYEARWSAGPEPGIPLSKPDGMPWTSINQTQAATAAGNACDSCHLVTEAEWMTIAADVLGVKYNWSGGEVGSGFIYKGHTNNNPASVLTASADDTDTLYGMTGGFGDTPGSNSSRVLYLKSGDALWDFSGNVWEWTTGTITGSQPGLASDSGDVNAYAWKDWNNSSMNWNNLPATSRPSALATVPGLEAVTSWNGNNGIGRLFSNQNQTGARGFLRGDNWGHGADGGILALNLASASQTQNASFGFRVAR